MILRPRSQQMLKPFQNDVSIASFHQSEVRKKIQNFSFLPNQKIGRGYSSIVYKGENDLTNQPVAIKVIQLKSLKDENTKRFLQNQLQCLRKLQNRNCLRYINSFMTTNNCYIITELYQGGDLSKELKKVGHFQQNKLFDIFSQFYSGYCHFYCKGFLHRDIKPSNILISNDQDYCIADFGFVKKVSEHPKDPFNVGTPVYMAPESITGNIYSQKSDIWSMGIMLFELAYGFLPFLSRNQNDLKRDICNRQIKLNLIEQNCSIFMSSQFKLLVTNCLRKNPQNRINLFDIKGHFWFRKFNKNIRQTQINTYTPSNLLLQRVISSTQSTQSHQFNQLNTQLNNKNNLQEQQKNYNYGYIGNQAIKRQRSIQGGHGYSLHNYYKSNQKKLIIKNKSTLKQPLKQRYSSVQRDKQNISMNVNLIKEKFKALDEVIGNNYDKFKSLQQNKNGKINFINNVFTEPLLERSFNMNGKNQYNDKEGAKLIDTKLKLKVDTPVVQTQLRKILSNHVQNVERMPISDNNTSLILTNIQESTKTPFQNNNKQKFICNNIVKSMNSEIILRQRSNISLNRIIESSPCFEINRSSLIEGMKNLVGLKNQHINKFKQLSKKKYCLDLNMKSQVQDLKLVKVKLKDNESNNQMENDTVSTTRDKLDTSESVQSVSTKNYISNHEYLIRNLHLLRFFNEVISFKVSAEQNSQIKKEIITAKQKICYYFAILLDKLTRMVSFKKQNIFKLEKWTEFAEEGKFKTFQDVLSKYKQKFMGNPNIAEQMKIVNYLSESQFYTVREKKSIQKIMLNLLRLMETIPRASKQNKSSTNGSIHTNQMIRVIFYYYKCLQILSSLCEKDERVFFTTNNPSEFVQQITTKLKDPFRIPKMIIELKKKLMIIQAQQQHQDNQIILKKLVC